MRTTAASFYAGALAISRVRACLKRLLDLIERVAQLLVREEELGALHVCRSSRHHGTRLPRAAEGAHHCQ